jgi:hypothetical protein
MGQDEVLQKFGLPAPCERFSGWCCRLKNDMTFVECEFLTAVTVKEYHLVDNGVS